MSTFVTVVNAIALVFMVAMVIRVLLSWFPTRPDNPLVIIVYQITEPVLAPLRRVVPRIGVIDITPVVAMTLLIIILEILDALDT